MYHVIQCGPLGTLALVNYVEMYFIASYIFAQGVLKLPWEQSQQLKWRVCTTCSMLKERDIHSIKGHDLKQITYDYSKDVA